MSTSPLMIRLVAKPHTLYNLNVIDHVKIKLITIYLLFNNVSYFFSKKKKQCILLLVPSLQSFPMILLLVPFSLLLSFFSKSKRSLNRNSFHYSFFYFCVCRVNSFLFFWGFRCYVKCCSSFP